MDRYDAIKLSALWSVWNSRRRKPKDDDDYDLDKIIRWYAKTFHTTIQCVQALPIDHVFEVYWLEAFEEMDEEELKAARDKALMDPEKLKELQRQEDEADYEVELMREEMMAENAASARDAGIKKLEDATAAIRDLTRDRPMFAPKESSLDMGGVQKQPDIRMEFGGDEADEDSDPLAFGLMSPPRK